MGNCKILVCCHKPTERLKDDVFTPILLGSAYADNGLKAEFQDDFWDSMGENIAQLHPYCAELTAIYWAWKNYEKLGNPDYIGLFHYRRFLNFGDLIRERDPWKCAFFNFQGETRERFGWNQDAILAFCKGYDMVLPLCEQILDPYDWKTPTTLETHYKHSHYPHDFDLAKDFIRENISGYANIVDRAANLKYGHFCNMFIMSKEKFFDYAKWLFDIILPLAELLPITDEKYEHEEQRRVLGFLGERLFNFWILAQKENGAKIRECQRLIGYLSESEKKLFIKTHGKSTYQKLLELPKLKMTGINVARAKIIEEEVDVYPSTSMQRPLVSVLVPVYNVAEFLEECIDSLISQTLKEIEFIFVYDSSKDNSLDILLRARDHDPRITVIVQKESRGLGGARNRGIPYAKGKYIAFIDADDICDITMFEKLYQKAELLGADIVTCSVMGFVDTLDNKYLHRQLEWFGDSDKILPLEKRPQQLMEPAAWCKLFRREYIQNLDFFSFREKTVAWEDVPAMTSAFIQTDRIATVQEALYYYRQRGEGNLSSNMTSRYTDEFIVGARLQQEILDTHHYYDEEVQSYIEEFKFLYAEWILSKMRKKDIPYFFHKVPQLFKKEDKKYLKRVFTLYPNRKRFYTVLMTRSALAYYSCKWGYHSLCKFKAIIKKAFHIRREDVYWNFNIGPIRIKKFKKSYYLQTVAWLRGQIDAQHTTAEYWHTVAVDVQNQKDMLEQSYQNKQAECIKLIHAGEKKVACLEEQICKLNELKTSLYHTNSELESKNALLNEENKRQKEDNLALRVVNEGLEERNQQEKERYTQLEKTYGDQSRRLEETERVLLDYRHEYDGFYHTVWTTGWVDVWKRYYIEKFAQIGPKVERLKQGLDDESKAVIDRHCYRNFELLPLQKDADLFLYNHSRIYTQEELEGAKRGINEEKLLAQYTIPEGAYFELPVFKFHCGLKYVPTSVLERVRGRDFIDAGASWGDSALVLNKYSPRKIIAFEPQAETFEALKQVIKDNQLDEIVCPIHCGLGEKDGTAKLYTGQMASGANMSGIHPVCENEKLQIDDICITTIDGFVDAHNLHVGVIKMDIEGNELAAIRGAMRVIDRDKPILLISVYHRPEDFFEIKPMLESMNLGYQFVIRKLVYHDLVTEVMLIAYVNE